MDRETDTPNPSSHGKLPPQLQALVDNDDESFYDDVYSNYSLNTTETPYRYAAYATRLRTLLASAHRYVAYTSDIGESFRPVAHPYLIRTAYGISWSYLIGDVVHEGYKAYLRNRRVLAPPVDDYMDASSHNDPQHQHHDHHSIGEQISGGVGIIKGMMKDLGDGQEQETLTPWPTTHIPLIEDYRMVMAKRGVFQSLASMGLPALTIHTLVKRSGRALKNSRSALLRTWGPIGLGLAVVPVLPYLFDEPVEHAVEWAFRTGLRAYAGEDAVRPLPQSVRVDTTALDRFVDLGKLKLSERDQQGEKVSEAVAGSWEEYKELRRRARDERNRKREEQGISPFAWLTGKSEKEDKSE